MNVCNCCFTTELESVFPDRVYSRTENLVKFGFRPSDVIIIIIIIIIVIIIIILYLYSAISIAIQ